MPAERRSGGTLAMRWMISGEWRAHPTRALTAAVAIAVGVGLGFAVHVINGSALNEFDRAVRTVNGDADLQVRAVGPQGFDERLYPKLARAPGIAAVSPVVELPALAGAGVAATPVTLLGLDVLRAAAVTPSLIGRRAEAIADDDIFDEQAVFLSQAALNATRKRAGDQIAISAAGRTAEFTVAGVLPGVTEGQALAVVDVAAAQWRFGRLGKLQRLDLRLAEGADPRRTAKALSTLLPPEAQLASGETEARRSDALSRAYRVNLDMLALMALLTGGFLVYSAQSLSVARRRPQFALLRVLGAERRALVTQVLVESLAVGGAGALAGLAFGAGLAIAGLRLFGGDLGGGYFEGGRPALVLSPAAALAFLLLGLAAALAGSALPAREAARAAPAAALKNLGDPVDPRRAPKVGIAAALLAAGAAAAFLPATGGLPLFGYVSIALILAGGVAATPRLSRILLGPLQRWTGSGPAIDLALKRLWGAPSQAALALCGIVASTSLMVAMAVMVWSFRGSVEDWLVQVLPADVYMRIEGPAETGGLAPADQRRLAAAPGVARIAFLKSVSLRLASDKPPVALTVRPIDRSAPSRSLPMIGRSRPVPPGTIPVWISEPAARIYGYKPGDRIRLEIGPGARVFIAGVWRDYARQHGAIAMDEADYARLTGDLLRSDAAITLRTGVRADVAIRALREALPPTLAARASFAQPRQLRVLALRTFDRSFAVTYVLEAIAVLVGLAGVAATVSAQTLARTKEFGMLRHVGVSRGQIAVMLTVEGGLLGSIGGVAGLGLGLALSQVLIHVVNPQSFHWTMDTRLPLPLFAVVAAGLIAASAGTALLAGRRALSADAVRAVREDW
jgi:putative ABC transport system permease protein